MSAAPPGDEVEGEALAALLGAVEAGDRLTLTLDPSDGVEETRVVESVSDAEKTPLDRENLAWGASRSGCATSTATPSRM